MKLSLIFTACIALGSAMSAQACAGEKPVVIKNKPSASASVGAKLIATRAGYTALPSAKSGSGVDMAYQMNGTPTVGQPLTISLDIASPLDADITLSTDGALTLQNPGQALKALAGQPGQHTITVVPQALGRFYVNVFSSAQGRSSATSIAVQVGDAQTKSKAATANEGAADKSATGNSATGQRTKTIVVP